MSAYASPSEKYAAYDADDLAALDERIILATQAGLPLSTKPYHALAEQLQLPVDLIQQRMQAMLDQKQIRRIAVVPNHYKLGFCANGMSVWNIADEHIARVGKLFGSLDYVSHCYHRPRHLPAWPYSVFAMVHGRDRSEVQAKVTEMSHLIDALDLGHDILYSKRILKKTGLRFKAD
ncbi:MAG: Lrp/AsnC family transcriptional regulator [Oceanospirillaceae bacterium]|nr:Lrp/AsnC family transcriptional regulator [Oceanospirillaceae bacterium]